MNSLVLLLGANVLALVLAILTNSKLTEVYAVLGFNLVLFFFIGLVNLTAYVQANLVKGETDGTERNSSES